jgi:hypothetical protein
MNFERKPAAVSEKLNRIIRTDDYLNNQVSRARVNIIMDAKKALMLTGIELLLKGASSNDLYGRMIRLTGHGLFALGRAGLNNVIESELNRDWLRSAGDLERDGLTQTHLREVIVEFKMTKTVQFESIFAGKSSLPLFQAATDFFRSINKQRFERARVVRFTLGIACLIIAEHRYSLEKRTMREAIERNAAINLIAPNGDNRVDFLSLLDLFTEFHGRSTSDQDSVIESVKQFGSEQYKD